MRTIVLVLAITSVAHAAAPKHAFVLYRVGAGHSDIVNPTLANIPYLPFSTFKIPNTLIGLSTGVIPNEKFAIPWDGVRREIDSWNRDQDLASAMRRSVVWFYQEVARRIGPERMKTYLRRFNYGNQNSCCAIDQFWLSGHLRITALQQVEFLRRVDAVDLPVKPEHVALVKRLLTLESTPEYTLQGKTGTGEQDGHSIGWLVGFVERAGSKWIYALLTVAQRGGDVPSRDARVDLTKKLLVQYGVLPPSATKASFHFD